MNKTVYDLIDIKQNKSKAFDVDELVGVCKRINNSKRDFLFVNKFQGKHFPQKPSDIFKMLAEFIENIQINDEKVLVIGFAETATAIGNYVSAKLPNCIYNMQTTREQLENHKPIIEFREEHCHAPQQLLYGDIEIFNNIQRVLFVEDEITTGKTIINFIKEINKINPNLKYAVASILNWQDEDSINLYKENNIDTFCLIKGLIKDVNAKVDVNINDEFKTKSSQIDTIKKYKIKSEICNLEKNRITKEAIKDIEYYSKYLFEKISQASKIINNICNEQNKKILVLGTEEFMYEPLLFAKYLEDNTQNIIKYHATTRSPIEISKENGYLLNERYRFSSCYEEERTTFLYNLDIYDYAFIITDSIVKEGFRKEISNIFYEKGYDLNNIEIISFSD